MDYIENIKKSFKIWWDHKYLWILGIIVAFFTSSSSNFRFNNDFGSGNIPPGFQDKIAEITSQAEKLLNTLGGIDTWVWILIGLAIFLFVIITLIVRIYLYHTSYVGLVYGTRQAYQNQHIGFRKSFSFGLKKFFKHFVYRFVLNLPIIILLVGIFVFFLIMIMTGVITQTESDAQFMLIPLVIIPICGMFIFLLVWQIFTYLIDGTAGRFLIWKNQGIFESIKSGFNFVFTNFFDYFISWVLWIIVSIILAIPFIFVIFFLAFIMLGILVAIFVMALSNLVVAIILAVIVLYAFRFIIACLNGPLVAFSQVYWSVVFLEIEKKNTLSSTGNSENSGYIEA